MLSPNIANVRNEDRKLNKEQTETHTTCENPYMCLHHPHDVLVKYQSR